ncbi:copper chaperone PCu(A)C [Streptomyces sp. NBC_00893]|uniref:copper chaperone PCu(A)C n=1 Tax=Streptomyces sp. NBC_00893 TaxID=2975862 RepID=UPI0022507B9C|nr:copper chaperone PCu(A)C [Streptomyces sp. NBC_00893]MCX4852169.1 copper chaperone PCu(A)C [Streptomyces sp. NBC_00893]
MKNLSSPGRPRRVLEATGTGAVVALTSLAAIGCLSTWTAAGYAGSPAKIDVQEARVLLPVIPGQNTNAYFHIVNTGGAPDRLRSVASSPASAPELTVHRMNTTNGAYRERSGSVEIPANGEVEMSPHGSAVTLRSDASWRPGDRVTFTLDFQRSGKVAVDAVVRPVTLGSIL